MPATNITLKKYWLPPVAAVFGTNTTSNVVENLSASSGTSQHPCNDYSITITA